MASIKKEALICSFCGKTFSKQRQYSAHITKHLKTAAGDKSIVLGFIDKGKASKQVQIKTCKFPNKIGKTSPKKNYAKRSKKKQTRKKNNNECSECGKTFNSNTNLENHMRIHTGEKPFLCSVCERGFSEKSHLRRHLRIHSGEKPYQCDVCDKYFSVRYSLRDHMKVHTGEKPYQCNICSKRFAQDSNLKKHAMIHTGERPYQCSVCSNAFRQPSHLNRHLKSHGIGLKPVEKHIQCQECDKAFSENANFRKHMRTHTGEKPYQCTKCEKSFSQTSNLYRHLKTHSMQENREIRKRTVEKPHQCTECEKAFSQKANLNKHQLKMHCKEKQYKCDQCEEAFSNIHVLEAHMRFHPGDKTLQSNISSKDLSKHSDLKKHSVIFTLGRPYKCNHCSISFAQKGQLDIHVESHSQDKPGVNQLTDHQAPDTEDRPYSFLDIDMDNHTWDQPKKKDGLSDIGMRLNFFQELSFNTY